MVASANQMLPSARGNPVMSEESILQAQSRFHHGAIAGVAWGVATAVTGEVD